MMMALFVFNVLTGEKKRLKKERRKEMRQGRREGKRKVICSIFVL